MVALERQARRDRARSRQRREYVEALQGADDEREAKDLLRRRAERLTPGSHAVVLTRNASGNSLEASTDPSAVARPGRQAHRRDPALVPGDPPRERCTRTSPAATPLQTCELCHRSGSGSLCVPSVVSGEVIGSLLVLKDRAIKPVERERVVVAVSQAAPILANLRNLAIAEHRAATDPLTKLPNARSVQEALIRMVAQAQRAGTPLSALVIDLDHFKALNDRHGHQAGDEVLEIFGATLRRGVRASDFAGRWGGEEFVVLLHDTGLEGAMQVAETMRASFEGLEVPGRQRARHRQPRGRDAPRPRHRRPGAHPRGRPRALPRQDGRPQPCRGRPPGGTARLLVSGACRRSGPRRGRCGRSCRARPPRPAPGPRSGPPSRCAAGSAAPPAASRRPRSRTSRA